MAAEKKGKIFELGFGGSILLSRSAFLGWQVGGIDFNQDAVALTKTYFEQQNMDTSELFFGSAMNFDSAQVDGAYDILISNGFLEHFVDPSILLAKWSSILKKMELS